MKTFKEFINESKNRYTDKEIKGLIDNAVEKPKVVYVDPNVTSMSPKKTKINTVPVQIVKLTTKRVKPLNLNHVRNAKDNGGVFVRTTVNNNPIVVVLYDKE